MTTWIVDTMAEMESKCGGNTDEQRETKRARIEEEEDEEDEDEFRKSERNQLFSATTAEDPHGYRWQLTFWTGLSDDDFNCDPEEEGMAVCVELDKTCPALANRIADDDDNKGKEWCAVVGVIRFAQNEKTNLILDFTHRFSKKNDKLPLFVHWASVKGEEGSLDQSGSASRHSPDPPNTSLPMSPSVCIWFSVPLLVFFLCVCLGAKKF